ncbi:hypothetical protein WICPIJ_003269 [Wickerhamomyces pijperi]|uniref:Uncharacterized protein n=1 Tax=Wickerhamomyces pijperi TaxID=599730 RepID=A0A9P8QA47_WICPI|nr:hypothetical protein WICPIJ_003269 [Wickerhamomyces pijperi]
MNTKYLLEPVFEVPYTWVILMIKIKLEISHSNTTRVLMSRAGVRWQQQEVLDGRRDHVPWVQVDDRGEGVKTESGEQRHNDVDKDSMTLGTGGKLIECKVQPTDQSESGGDGEKNHTENEQMLGTLRSVTHGDDEQGTHRGDGYVVEDREESSTASGAESSGVA